MANEHYSAFISEAFIEPIRSVLIVDDDYPTLDELLDQKIDADAGDEPVDSRKKWLEAPARFKAVIDGFRKPHRSLLVDVHDGTNVAPDGDAKVASHLHQSDLLVLDFELDRTKPRDGQRAVEILRNVLSNNHFNLVVVHTSEDLDFVFRKILFGLLAETGDGLEPEDEQRAIDAMAKREDEDEDFLTALAAAVGPDQYSNFRRFPKAYLRTMAKGEQPFAAFAQVAEDAGWDRELRKLVLQKQLLAEESKLRKAMNDTSPVGIEWSTGGVQWIKSESVFVAFSDKSEHEDLLQSLQRSLEAWSPQPSRLFLNKLRAEIDDYGVVAQSAALERQHALAHWYNRLLEADGEERRWLISESVSRHSDQLLNIIFPRVEKFATDLVEAEAAVGTPTEHCKRHFQVDLENENVMQKAATEHNAFVSSKEPQGWHLNTGHVFRLEDEFWVCLTPACDLVPNQNKARADAYGGRLPFTALKLYPAKEGRKVDAYSGLFVYLTLANEVKVFKFNEQGKEGSAPQSQNFYADSLGRLSEDLDFKVSRIEAGSRRLISVRQSAKVVSQLRYEYALNLLQRLGNWTTRIGLDFVE